MYLWYVESTGLAEAMHEDGHSAVIEQTYVDVALAKLPTTKVHSESRDLIATIRNHADELLGEPHVFILVE